MDLLDSLDLTVSIFGQKICGEDVDSSHLFSFYGRNWGNTGCKVSFFRQFHVIPSKSGSRTHSTLLCAPSKKPML